MFDFTITTDNFVKENNTFALKISLYIEDDFQTRRVKLPQIVDSTGKISYEKLVDLVIKFSFHEGVGFSFPESSVALLANKTKLYNVELTYRDVDSDLIHLGSTEELMDAFEQYLEQHFVRISAKVERRAQLSVPLQIPQVVQSTHVLVQKGGNSQNHMSTTCSAGDIIAVKERKIERLQEELESCQAELKYYQDMDKDRKPAAKTSSEQQQAQIIQLLIQSKVDLAAEKYQKFHQLLPYLYKREISTYVQNIVDRDIIPCLFPDLPPPLIQVECKESEQNTPHNSKERKIERPQEEQTVYSSAQQGTCNQDIIRESKLIGTNNASRASIKPASKSVRSLPREIELADDEANNDDTSIEVTFNDRSYAGRVSRVSNKKRSYANYYYRRRHNQRSGSVETYEVKKQAIVDIYGERGTYAGSLSKATGMPHGKGRLEYAAGRWYEGDWKHGRWTGHGRLSNGDGDLYEGELRNDHKHGKGTMRFVDGRVFVGEYINGQMIEGKMTYQDGSNYEGSWVDGMRHGRGKCVFTDASVYEGEFTEGKFHGHGKMSWSDGGWYEGEWCSGDMQGFGKEVRPDGSIRHEGHWSKGQPLRERWQT